MAKDMNTELERLVALVPPELMTRVRIEAAARGWSMSELARAALTDWLDDNATGRFVTNEEPSEAANG